MIRRTFIAIGAAIAFAIGCRRPSSNPMVPPATAVGFGDEPTLIDPCDRIGRALQLCQSDGSAAFDPITISIVATILGQLIRHCLDQRMLKLQNEIKRRPQGAAAVRFRGKLYGALEQYRSGEVELFAEPHDVRKHVTSAISAFTRATPDELRSLKADLDKDQMPPTPRMEATARDIERIVD